MRQSSIETTARHRATRHHKADNRPQYTRTEIGERFAELTEELQHGKGRLSEQVWKDIDDVLGLWENSPRYTLEEINASLDKAMAEIKAGECIPHEQAMKEIDEFMECL